MFGLVDCNNFFASCEQVFNPKLKGKPLVILSNNDGCIIARSQEAKKLGIPMGAPAFEYKELFFKGNVITYSPNFALYSDMSGRVMTTLEQFGFDVQIYSIDEAFLEIPPISQEELEKIAKTIRNTVLQWTGLPVSIGIDQTLTRAKAANRLAKKGEGAHVNVTDSQLDTFPVEDLWGIGRKLTASLHSYGIKTALQLKNCNDGWIKKHLSVTGLRTVWELRGTPSISLDDSDALSKTLVCSRSFGQKVTTLSDLQEAVASFTAKAAARLRSQNAASSFISVFAISSQFYTTSRSLHLPAASSDTPTLLGLARHLAQALFQEGTTYRKAGVFFAEISSKKQHQPDLWHPVSPKREALMKSLDQIQHHFGERALYFAAEGLSQPWKSRSSRCSPPYTTSWDDLLQVK